MVKTLNIGKKLAPTRDTHLKQLLCILSITLISYATATTATPFQMSEGPFAVGSTSLRVEAPYRKINDTKMDLYLKGGWKKDGTPSYLSQILTQSDKPHTLNVKIPNEPHFDVHAGETLPLVLVMFYPTTEDNPREPYAFPYTETARNSLPHMQRGDDKPLFASDTKQYPCLLYTSDAADD